MQTLPGEAGIVGRPAADGLDPAALEVLRRAEATIAKVTADVDERFSFHTAISAIQELTNAAGRAQADMPDAGPGAVQALRHAAQTAVSLLFPFAPHVSCELWEALGGTRLWATDWPQAEPSLLVKDVVTVVLQVNGKLRDRVEVPAGSSQDELLAVARASAKIATAIEGKELLREIVVPDRLVNLVVR